MTNTRIVILSYALFAILIALFLENVLRQVWAAVDLNDAVIAGDWTTTSAIGFGIAITTAIVCWTRDDVRTVSFEITQELRRVTWPGKDETRSATIAVIVVSVIVAVLLGSFDFVWSKLTAIIYETPRYLGS